MIHVLPGSFVLLTAAALSAQEPSPATRASAPSIEAPRPEAVHGKLSEEVLGLRSRLETLRQGKPGAPEPTSIKVNGEVLPAASIVREIVYRTASRAIPQKITELLIIEQMDEQIRKGAKAESFDIDEKEVDERVRAKTVEFAKANPGKSFADQLRTTNMSMTDYRVALRNELLIDRVFFPGLPEDWPESTVEAILASAGPEGRGWWAQFKDSNSKAVPTFWLAILRQWVTKQLAKRSDVRFASDGIPKDAVLLANGRPWTTEDAKRAVVARLAPEDLDRAVTEIVLATALRQELVRKNCWMSDASFRKEFKEYAEPHDQTPFTIEVLALTFKGYPSVEAFKARWRLRKSYENMIAQEIDDVALMAHAPRTTRFAESKLDVQYIRVPAFDDALGTWREDGWTKAKAEATAALDAIEKGMDFAKAIGTFGKYKPGDEEKGLPGAKCCNELRQKLGESEYLDFVNGVSVARVLFEDVKAGQVIGPIRGNDGYVIARVVDRTDPQRAITLQEPKTRELVREDYLTTRFLDWARGIAAKTTVE